MFSVRNDPYNDTTPPPDLKGAVKKKLTFLADKSAKALSPSPMP